MTPLLVWSITILSLLWILIRPRNWPEAVWATLGAALLIALRLISPRNAFAAIAKGTDVYFFLAGMMLLSELAREKGVFDWLAGLAARASGGNCSRLFLLVYLVGTVVTIFLSNDATAVVLTPAVYAVVKKVDVDPLPYLFICAFIANAASFVLPISNPANLVVFGQHLPSLLPWLRMFLVPSLASILLTFVTLRWYARDKLHGPCASQESFAPLSADGARTAWGILLTAIVVLIASAFGVNLGVTTFICGSLVLVAGTRIHPTQFVPIVRQVSWSVLPLVAGLFVLVEALNEVGTQAVFAAMLHAAAELPSPGAALASSFGIALLSNLMNNLPAGLLAGGAVAASHVSTAIRQSVLIGIDLGPNLSVTGSLATILWLIALRREGERVTAWTFLKAGVLIMPAALIAATLCLYLTP